MKITSATLPAKKSMDFTGHDEQYLNRLSYTKEIDRKLNKQLGINSFTKTYFFIKEFLKNKKTSFHELIFKK